MADEPIWINGAEIVWSEIVEFLAAEHGFERLRDLPNVARYTVIEHIALKMRALA